MNVTHCVQYCNISFITTGITHAAEIDHPEEDASLHSASENPQCDVRLIKVLIDNGANLNIKNIHGDTPLHLFVRKCLLESYDKNIEILKLLLKSGAEPNAHNAADVTPFLMAIHPPYCHLNACIGADRSNEFQLHKSLLPTPNHIIDVMKLLLQYDPQLVKSRDTKGRTPLHIAVFEGASIDIVKELINMGADVNASDEEGNTPLHQTTLTTYSVIETLVRSGAVIDAKNRYGKTPLHESICRSQVNTTAISAFLELGADVELGRAEPFTFYKTNKSALYYALLNPSIPLDIVKLIIKKVANPASVNFQEVFFKKNRTKGYVFTSNEEVALLYIQYFLFYRVLNEYVIDEPKSTIKFDKYSPEFCNVFSKFRNSCISELLEMKWDWLSNGTNLYSFVWGNIGKNRPTIKYTISLLKEVLVRIRSNIYPCCNDLLRASINREILLNYLSCSIVYTTVMDTNNSKQSVILNLYSTEQLAKYLNQDTLLNLIEAFSDDLSTDIQRKSCNIPVSADMLKLSESFKCSTTCNTFMQFGKYY